MPYQFSRSITKTKRKKAVDMYQFKDSKFYKQAKKKNLRWSNWMESSFITNFGLIESGIKRIWASYVVDPSRWPSTNFKWSCPPHNTYFLYHFHLYLSDFWLYSRFLLEKKTSKFLHPILIKTIVKWKIWMEHCLKYR